MAEAMDNTDAVVSCNNHCSNDVKMAETNDESNAMKKKLDNAVEMKDSNNSLLDTSVQDHSMNLGLFKKDDSGIDMDKSPTSSSSAKDSGVEKSPASIKDCSLLSDLEMSECINESQTDSGATSRTNSVGESSKICDKISSGLSERNCNGNKEEEKCDGTDVKNDKGNKEVKDAEELENDKTGEDGGSDELSYMPVSLDTEDSDPTGSYDITMPSTLDSDDEDENPAATFIKVNKNLRGKRKFRIPKIDSDSDTESEDERVTTTANVQSRTNKDLDLDDFSDGHIEDDDDDDDDVDDKKSSENKSESEEEEETDTDDVKPKHIWKALYDLRGREYGHSNRTPPAVFREKVQGSLQMVQRLKLQYKMECHDGCVNALHFNRIGTLLASGSDDLNVVLWNWVKNRPSLVYDSGHRSNVFQAKFMPFSGDCHVVSCARDGQVRLAELSLTGVCKNTKKLAQHKGAAHKLALELDSPHVFLSCGEDAMVYEIDLRQEKPNKLCQTKENDRKVPLYSIHSNPVNSFEFCVGGRDHFVRVYDKRKIANEENGGLVKKFCPHHLVDSNSKANVTCAVYNFNGTEILGSYNDDDIYLFDNLHSDGADFIKRYKGHRNNATGEYIMPRRRLITLPHLAVVYEMRATQGLKLCAGSNSIYAVQLVESQMERLVQSNPSGPTSGLELASSNIAADFKSMEASQNKLKCFNVKGVNFFGPRSEFVVSGSDCGHIYLWDKETEQVVQFMEGDEGGVINVLEPHPFAPVLATSGLDHDVKVWAPTAEEPTKLQELKKTSKKNKKERDEDRSSEPRGLEEMIDGPMLYYLMRQIHRARRRNDPRGDHSSSNESSDSDSDESDDEVDRLQCAQS